VEILSEAKHAKDIRVYGLLGWDDGDPALTPVLKEDAHGFGPGQGIKVWAIDARVVTKVPNFDRIGNNLSHLQAGPVSAAIASYPSIEEKALVVTLLLELAVALRFCVPGTAFAIVELTHRWSPLI
jgi:hypothetical protein